MKTILVTGIGAPGAVSIINHLRNNIQCKIIGVDCSIEYCAAKYYVDDFYQISKAKDNSFLNDIIDMIKKFNITNIISLVTDELYIFAKNKALLTELNVEIFISSYESIKNSSNKYNLYESLKVTIDLPKYKKINLRDIKNYLYEFDYPNNEVCFKPLTLDGARGFRVLSDKIDSLKQIMTEKPYNFYLTIEELELLFNKSDYECDVLLSEYLPGKEYTVDTFVENNKIKAYTIRERLRLKDHISFVGKTVNNRYIEEQIQLINRKFDFKGSIGYQFKENSHGIPLLLECNPRLQGATILSCKNNFDYILANIGITRYTKNTETLMMRYFGEVYESDGKMYK